MNTFICFPILLFLSFCALLWCRQIVYTIPLTGGGGVGEFEGTKPPEDSQGTKPPVVVAHLRGASPPQHAARFITPRLRRIPSKMIFVMNLPQIGAPDL